MQDVARRVGVSRTTVSFVLSDRPSAKIPESTRRSIWDAVEELGYRPNAAAQGLASQKTRLIGLITDIATSAFAGDIIQGAQETAWANNKLLLIASSPGDPELDAAIVQTMLERRVEGILYATSWHHEVSLPKAADEVPVVLVNCFDRAGAFTSILPDEEGGGYLATRALLDAGHRRIAFINLDPDIPAAVGRRAGYARALAEFDIAVDEVLVPSGHADADGGYACATDLLELPEPPTALFCGTDRMAMGAYEVVKERGLRIPQDIAIVGFDNQEIIAAYLRPKLTTIALPLRRMGSMAINALTELDHKPRSVLPPQRQIAHCPLIKRSSH
jgi:LacI family transcriptional regulator